MKSAIVLFIGLFLLFPLFSYAQEEAVGADIIATAVTLRTVPATLVPSTPFTVILESSAIDLDTTSIVWRINGTIIASGKGVKTITATAGNIGSRMVIAATITSAIAAPVTKNLVLSIGDIDIMWQGDSYVPPFYEGRSFWPTQGRLIVLAVPHITNTSGTEINPQNLIYRWTKNGTVQGSISGAGRNTYTYDDTSLSLPQNIKVDVLDNDGAVSATASFDISPITPRILVYEDNPLYGSLFNQEIKDSYSLRDKEVSFQAFPLFFSASSREGSPLTYLWRANNQNVGTASRITFRAPEDSEGSTAINLDVNSILNTQGGNRNFLVQFKNESGF